MFNEFTFITIIFFPDESKNVDINLPDWVAVGESVLIRPYNTSGVISYVGTTHFQAGTWIGVELDTPTGKNDGSVQGIQYFQCKPKHGIFVRFDKLILDKRGKAMRAYKAEKTNKGGIKNVYKMYLTLIIYYYRNYDSIATI